MSIFRRESVPGSYSDSDVPPLELYTGQLEHVETDSTPREPNASENKDIAAIAAAMRTMVTDEIPDLVQSGEEWYS